MAEVLDIVVRQRGARRVAKDIAQIGISAGFVKTQLAKLQISLRNTNSAFTTAGRGATTYAAKLKKTTAAVKVIDKALVKTKASLVGIGTGAAIAGAALVAGFLRPLKAAVQSAADFQTAISLTGVLTNVERASTIFKELEETARQIGLTTQFTAVQAAEGLSFLALAGFNARDAMDSLESVTLIAAAANIDLGRAAEITTNILKGFGLEVKDLPRAVDILASTFSSSNVSIEQLAKTFEAVGPIARDAGQSFEEVAAIAGILGDAGIQGEKAGVAFRRILINIQQDADKTNSVLAKFGINIRDKVTGNVRSLVTIFEEIAVSGISSSEIIDLFGARALAAGGIISKASDILKIFSEILANDTGRALEIAEARLFGFNGAMLKLQSAVDAFGRAVVDSGLLDFLTEMIVSLTELIREAAKLDPKILKLVGVLAGLLGALGAVLVPLGLMSIGIGTLKGALAGLSFAPLLAGLRGLLLFFGGPIGITIGVVVVAFLALKDIEFDLGEQTVTLGGLFETTFEQITKSTKSMTTEVGDYFENLFNNLDTFLGQFEDTNKKILEGVGTIAEGVVTGYRITRGAIEITLTGMLDSTISAGDKVLNFLGKIPSAIKAEFDGDDLTSAGGVFGTSLISGVEGAFDNYREDIKDMMLRETLLAIEDFESSPISFGANLLLQPLQNAAQPAPGGGGESDLGAPDVVLAPLQNAAGPATETQRQALEALEDLTNAYTPGAAAARKMEEALRIMNFAIQQSVLGEDELGAKTDEVREILGIQFLESINPVTKALGERKRALAEVTAQQELFGFSSEDAAISQQLISEEFEQRLLQIEAYRQGLVGLEAAQAGVTEGLRQFALTGKTQYDVIKGATNELAGVITNSLVGALREGEFSFKEFALSVVQSIQSIVVKLLIQILLQTILNSLTGGSTGIPLLGIAGSVTPAAEGGNIGPSQTGQSFLVGEKGPELFVPRTTGEVIPNAATTAMLGGAGAAPPVVNVQVVNVDDPQSVVDAMNTQEGEQVIVNIVQRNRGKLKEILG